MSLKSFTLALVGSLALAASASAATVTFKLDTSVPGTFTLTAAASAGDNAGISFYSVPLLGEVATLDHRTPFGVNGANFAPAGFNVLRSGDNGGTNPNILASQDSITGPAANLLYGIGQDANSFANLGITTVGLPDATSDIAWLAPIVLATGTYTGAAPTINAESVDFVANVFATAGSRDTPAATALVDGGTVGVAPVAVDLNLLDLDTTVTPIALGTTTTSAGDPPITFGDLTFVSYTATNSGVDDGAAGAGALLGSDGAFSFPINGRARGEYLFSYNATNTVGSDSGNILVEIQAVPEPTTLALCGLAVVGSLGLIRRRNG